MLLFQNKTVTPKEPITHLKSYASLILYAENGKICLECDEDFQEDNHIMSQLKCVKCNFQTACSRTILQHAAHCTGTSTSEAVPLNPLGKEFYCICGFSSSEGNDLAKHLATCERKSAYETTEAAQENTVKCNMLDMLGLVRRDGEEDEDSNDGLLIPADQQQQLLSKSIERSEQDEEEKSENEKKSDDSNSKDKTEAEEEQSGEATAQTSDEPPLPPPTQQQPNQQAGNPQAQQSIDDFNTQLSLDDLGPQSVAPQPEPDRTPQLSDEYQVIFSPLTVNGIFQNIKFVFYFKYIHLLILFQSLATPRVASYPPQYDQNEYEMPPNN